MRDGEDNELGEEGGRGGGKAEGAEIETLRQKKKNPQHKKNCMPYSSALIGKGSTGRKNITED